MYRQTDSQLKVVPFSASSSVSFSLLGVLFVVVGLLGFILPSLSLFGVPLGLPLLLFGLTGGGGGGGGGGSDVVEL